MLFLAVVVFCPLYNFFFFGPWFVPRYCCFFNFLFYTIMFASRNYNNNTQFQGTSFLSSSSLASTNAPFVQQRSYHNLFLSFYNCYHHHYQQSIPLFLSSCVNDNHFCSTLLLVSLYYYSLLLKFVIVIIINIIINLSRCIRPV